MYLDLFSSTISYILSLIYLFIYEISPEYFLWDMYYYTTKCVIVS